MLMRPQMKMVREQLDSIVLKPLNIHRNYRIINT